MITKDPEYLDMVEELTALEKRLDALTAKNPNGYWQQSARKHFATFRHTCKLAFHEAPPPAAEAAKPAPVVVIAEEDLF